MAIENMNHTIARIAERVDASEKPIVVRGFGLSDNARKTVFKELSQRLDITSIDTNEIWDRLQGYGLGIRFLEVWKQQVAQAIQKALVQDTVVLVNAADLTYEGVQRDTEQFRKMGAEVVGGLLVVEEDFLVSEYWQRNIDMATQQAGKISDWFEEIHIQHNPQI